MLASMIARSQAKGAADARIKCIRKTYVNTDAQAATENMTPQEYGALVENRLLSLYGAKASPDWLNRQFSGQSIFAKATPQQRALATAHASTIKTGFGNC